MENKETNILNLAEIVEMPEVDWCHHSSTATYYKNRLPQREFVTSIHSRKVEDLDEYQEVLTKLKAVHPTGGSWTKSMDWFGNPRYLMKGLVTTYRITMDIKRNSELRNEIFGCNIVKTESTTTFPKWSCEMK